MSKMNINDVMSSSCDLFRKGKFTECCDFLQNTVDNFHLNKITTLDEIELIILRNNLLVCDCLRILSDISSEYVKKMTELFNFSTLYLHEKHIPLELRVNYVCNTLYWFWLKPDDIPDYCYDKVLTLVSNCLHEILLENGKSVVNVSSLVDKEEDILNSLECLSNKFLSLKPILVIQCLEISQVLQLVFLSRQCFTSLLVHFTTQITNKTKTITRAFEHSKHRFIGNCFKLGLSKINTFLDLEQIKTVVVCAHVSLCIKYILENQYRQALCTLSAVDQFLDSNDELLCVIYYLNGLINFNLKEFDKTLYYLSQMTNCLMEPFIKSRCYLLLGRTHSKIGNSDLAIETFEKLKETKYNKIMAYYMSLHYEMNKMQFAQIMVLEQAIKDGIDSFEDINKDFSFTYSTKVLIVLHPQPDFTKRQLLYLTAKKKYEHSSYKLAASDYLNLLKLNDFDQYMSDLVTIPPIFMLKHEAAVTFLKAREMKEASKLCQSLIEEFEPGFGMWESDSFWANELNNYNFNVVGSLLLAETGFDQNTDIVLEALNKSFNCLYEKVNPNFLSETRYDERINTLRQILIGKVLLLRAMILSKLNNEEECDTTFKKALTYNTGDEDIVYLYSKWLEHKGKLSQSINVRNQFDRKNINTITCDNLVINYVLENKHDLEDSIIGHNVIDDLFDSEENAMEVDNEMDSADDDIFKDLFLD